MKKNGRLDNIIKLIPNDTEILADIGCDHGKIIVSAILTGKAKKGFAVDISKNSLNKAKKLAETVGIYQNIEFICGDGFNNINQNIDTVIIAGMGGNEIISILNQKHFAKTYILCPHQNADILRRYINSNKLSVINDFYIKEKNKYYPIIMVQKGRGDCYTEDEMFLGKNIPPNDLYKQKNYERYLYLNKLLNNNIEYSKFDETLIKEYEVLLKWLKLQK